MRMGLSAIIKGVAAHKKALLIGGLIFVLVVGVGAASFRIYSHQEFEKFVARLESFSQQELSIILALDGIEKEMSTEFDKISFKETANMTENRKHLAKTEELTDELYKKQEEEYLPLIGEEITKVNEFLDRRYLWFWGKEKDFLSSISSVSENATKAKDADALLVSRSKLLHEVSFVTQSDAITYIGFVKDYNPLTTSLAAATKALAPLKKYTTASYKFPGQDEIKTLYPTLYTALLNYKAFYGKIYEMIIAYANRDYSKAMRLSEEITTISKRSFDLTVDWGPITRPFLQAEIDAHTQGLLASSLYKENKLGKVSLGQRRLAALAIVWAEELYGLDHKNVYLQATNIESALTLLKDGKYLPSEFTFDQTTFVFSSSKTKYQISFTDEVTGQEVSLSSVD